MATSQAGSSTISNFSCGQNSDYSSFFRTLSAPFVAPPLLPVEPEAPMPRVGDPQAPQGLKPLAWPLHTSTGKWAWLNGKTFYDIHDLVTLHGKRHVLSLSNRLKRDATDDELHTMTIRACRVGDQTLTYLNKSLVTQIYIQTSHLRFFSSWKLASRHPGAMSEVGNLHHLTIQNLISI